MNEFKVDFFVVGAARSGTTSLYRYLKQHPQIFLPEIKELNFFSEVKSVIPADYEPPETGVSYHMKVIRSADVYESAFEGAAHDMLKGDVSPSYLSNTETAARIYAHNPDARIVISLRNPVQRAFSHYLMNLAVGYDQNESFEAALEADKSDVWSGGNRYLDWSCYADAVASYYDVFPKEQIHVMIFEEWIREMDTTLTSLFEFLKVDSSFEPDLGEKHNEKVAYKHIKTLNFLRKPGIKGVIEHVIPKAAREKLKRGIFKADEMQVTLDSELENRLMDHFSSDIEKLETITGISLDKYWKSK